MGYHLFVGDIYENLANSAKNLYPSAYLLTDHNYNTASGTVYTSIADMENLELFYKVCEDSDEITYCPPDTWSDKDKKGASKQKQFTEDILIHFSQFKSIHNLPTNRKNFLKQDFLRNPRKIQGTQIWVAGCSITKGSGVKEGENWKTLVTNVFQLPYSDLSLSASSIQFASDQICRSDIKSKDLVFWQLTSHERYPAIDPENNELIQVNTGRYKTEPEMVKNFDINRLQEPSLYYQNVLAVRRVVNFCNKINAKLVILGVMYDWDSVWQNFNVPCYCHLLCWPAKWLDFGSDKIHPGPLEHKKIADKFLKFYQELYG